MKSGYESLWGDQKMIKTNNNERNKQLTFVTRASLSHHIFPYLGVWRWFKISRREIAVKICHSCKTTLVEFLTTWLISSKLQFTFVTAMTNISSLLWSEIFDYNSNSSVIYFRPEAKRSARLP